MNKIYLDKDGKVLLNGNEIKDVVSVSTKSDWLGTKVIIELDGDFKSDYQSKEKAHSLVERAKG